MKERLRRTRKGREVKEEERTKGRRGKDTNEGQNGRGEKRRGGFTGELWYSLLSSVLPPINESNICKKVGKRSHKRKGKLEDCRKWKKEELTPLETNLSTGAAI